MKPISKHFRINRGATIALLFDSDMFDGFWCCSLAYISHTAARLQGKWSRLPQDVADFKLSGGASDHCETQNRSVLNDQVLDWLDEVIAASIH